MSFFSAFRGAEGERINSNWTLQPDGTRQFTAGVTDARKTRKNARFLRIVRRKFKDENLPVDLINMAGLAYEDLSKAHRTIRDPKTRSEITKFMISIRKDISRHLQSISYKPDEEKHKNEFEAYNDFLFHYYYDKYDKIPAIGRTNADRAEQERQANRILLTWCLTIQKYRASYHQLQTADSMKAFSLCNEILEKAANNDAAASAAAAASASGGDRSRRTRKMKRS